MNEVTRMVVRGVVKGNTVGDLEAAPKVAIKAKTSQEGVTGYWADCQNCPWYCHEEPHAREATAARHAVQHDCEVAKLDNYQPGPKAR